MKLCRITMMTFASCFWSVNCVSPSFVPTCMAWPERSIEEFQEYVRENGETTMVRSVLRDAQLCAALKELSDG